MQLLAFVSRLFFGVVFILSGFVKSIDPLGMTYKLQDFFTVFRVEWLFPVALPFSVFLGSLEFLVGFAFLLGLTLRITAPVGFIIMAIFTPATLYIALTDPVPHCGCFGDAIILTNWETFYKNILLLAAAAVVFFNRKKIRPFLSYAADGYITLFAGVFIVSPSLYCLFYLPLIDFRPWKIGNDVGAYISVEQGPSPDVHLIFKNRKTGAVKKYPADNYPWYDPEWAGVWEYEARVQQTDELRRMESPLENFIIVDASGEDLTEPIINRSGYQYLVVAYDLQTTNKSAFYDRVSPLAENAMEHGYPFLVLTASSYETIEEFRERQNAAYPFFQSDERELKTIIRSNPGLVLLKDGVVKGKWPHRRIPLSLLEK